MNCKRCGAPVEVRRENYDYSSSGLPVTLCDVQVRTCPQCGERGAAIPNIEGLHRAIAMAVIPEVGTIYRARGSLPAQVPWLVRRRLCQEYWCVRRR